MIQEQIGGAFIAALLGQGVGVTQIERAVLLCEGLRVGQSIIVQTMDCGLPPHSASATALMDYTHATWKRLETL